jgi:hypothetical protein
MKTDSKKRSLRLGKFIARVYNVYLSRQHGHYGTDADHLPMIPGNDFAPGSSNTEESPIQHPASGNMDMGQAQSANSWNLDARRLIHTATSRVNTP